MENNNYQVHESSYIDDNVYIGTNTRIWHYSHIQSGAHIGNNCTIGQNVNVANNVKIGNMLKFRIMCPYMKLRNSGCFCGPSMVFTNVHKPRCEYPQRGSEFYSKTLIKKICILGAKCTIVCGNTVGEYAFIGAGTVVTIDVPDYALVGNPGKIVGWVDKEINRFKQ